MAILEEYEENIASSERVEQIYDSSVLEHPEFLELGDQDRLKEFIALELGRIASFEALAQQPLVISPETAENISAVRIHSGVGNYDQPIKDDDNARLIKPWLYWADRRRIDHAVRIARKVAEVRSGYSLADHRIEDKQSMRRKTRELIREFGPYVVYSGYPSETAKAEEVLDRPDTIIPREKAVIVHGTPRNTVEGSKMMAERFADGFFDNDKQVVIVSHAPHIARILHIMDRHPYLPADAVPYVAPVATAPEGKDEFALMEIRGMLNYIYLTKDAGEEAHPYQLLTEQDDD